MILEQTTKSKIKLWNEESKKKIDMIKNKMDTMRWINKIQMVY